MGSYSNQKAERNEQKKLSKLSKLSKLNKLNKLNELNGLNKRKEGVLRLLSLCVMLFCLLLFSPSMLFGLNWEHTLQQVLSESDFPAIIKSEITVVFLDAEEQGISPEILMPRLEEGLAKRVPPGRIISALEREIEAYSTTKNIFVRTLEEQSTQTILQSVAPWSRTVTLYLQGVTPDELSKLLRIFEQQNSAERWNNYRYAANLYVALLDWGLEPAEGLDIIRAVAQSTLPGESYRGILEILSSGLRLRVSPEKMVNRIINELVKVNSLAELRERVLY